VEVGVCACSAVVQHSTHLVLQSVAVCCSVLQCVAVCCSVLQCVAVCCSVLQCVAECCSVLQRVQRSSATLYTFSATWNVAHIEYNSLECNALLRQHTAEDMAHCDTLHIQCNLECGAHRVQTLHKTWHTATHTQ